MRAATLTISSEAPPVLQTDGTSCGHRCLLGALNPGHRFDLSQDVVDIQGQILEARRRAGAQQVPEPVVVDDEGEEEEEGAEAQQIAKLALVIACKLGRLNSVQRQQVEGYCRNEGGGQEWDSVLIHYINEAPDSGLMHVRQLAANLHRQGVMYPNARDLCADGVFENLYGGGESGLQTLRAHLLAHVNQEGGAVLLHQQHDDAHPLIVNQNEERYELQGPDVSVWCTYMNDQWREEEQAENPSAGTHRAYVASRGSLRDPLVAVSLVVKDVLASPDRPGPVVLDFIVNNDTTSSDLGTGSHWTRLRVTVQPDNTTKAVLTDSLRNASDKSFERSVCTSIRTGFEMAGLPVPVRDGARRRKQKQSEKIEDYRPLMQCRQRWMNEMGSRQSVVGGEGMEESSSSPPQSRLFTLKIKSLYFSQL